MSDQPTEGPPSQESSAKATIKQERSAAIIAILAVAVILVVGSPCICYFGLGLFQGIHSLRTGQFNNPARRSLHKKYKRPELAPNNYGRSAPKVPRSTNMVPSGR